MARASARIARLDGTGWTQYLGEVAEGGAKTMTKASVPALSRSRGMRMPVHSLEMRGPIAAFNGRIIVQPDGG